MSLADGIAWEQEFGVSEASRAADAALSPTNPHLTGRDPMAVFPTPTSAADVQCYRPRETTGGPVPFMPMVELTPEQRAQIFGDKPAPRKVVVRVYLDNGVVFTYEVDSISSAREHASAIIATGYRSVQIETPDVLTHYPPHRILKVTINGQGAPLQTTYYDKVLGT